MSHFGELLRRHRSARACSQERLARDAEVSARHVSFLETGRASPSREMVLLLSSALDLPLRERNALLLAAGFAPAYRESELSSPALREVRHALERVLAQQEPYPAVVFDRYYQVRMTNGAAARMMGMLLDASAPPEVLGNAMHASLSPLGFRPWLVNFDEVAAMLIARLAREQALEPDDAALRALLDASLAYPDVAALLARAGTLAAERPFVEVHIKKGPIEARFFTMLTTLGTPMDVTAQELRIETYFPADDATDRLARAAIATA